MRLVLLALLIWAQAALAAPRAPVPESEPPTWEKTLDRVVRGVVALRVTATRDFDTEDASTSVGTGFVVDAERGLILTNRHMVHAGPVQAKAIFLDNEEVELQAIYRDPVHDFGFYRFDPKAVKFMDVVALPLAPEDARVGMEIRVVGNDAGEKISILDGTLARLDRNAPYYGSDTYNDFNTFYYQAASNTSGGSSGSPVVDIRGRVVALNAGGNQQAASSFYLPLHRVERALDYLRRGQQVPRGTIQAVFEYTPYDEVRRLGLRTESEADMRAAFPQSTGLLVVSETVPGGPAWEKLEAGDVLLRVGERRIGGFDELSAVLDDAVGTTVTLELERGGRPIAVPIGVGDLHAITPDEYLEIGRAVLHAVSFQQARNHGVPAAGVYVAVPGYWLSVAGVPEAAVITEVDGTPTPDLDAFQAEIEEKAHGRRVQLRWHQISDPRHEQVVIATVDRLWYPMARCRRDDVTGRWPCTESPPPPTTAPIEPQAADIEGEGPRVARRLAPSLGLVEFDIPHPTAGIKDFNFVGAGLVVDAERGLVLVDRDTVPVTLGDMRLTFGGLVRVPGRVVYLHPVHNIAVVRYDPTLLADTPVRAAVLRDEPLAPGERVWQVGIDSDQQVVSTRTRVEEVEALELGISGTPRFRDANVEGVTLHDAAPSVGGVLCDRRGRVLALWASFVDQASGDRSFYGLPIRFAAPAIEALRDDRVPEYRWLGAEFGPVSIAEARERGLSPARAEALRAHDPSGRKVLQVVRTTGGTPADALLRDGDILLAVNEEPVTRVGELEVISSWRTANLTVLRAGEEVDVAIDTVPADGDGVDRVISWAGVILHDPHFEVAAQQGIEADGVYMAWMWYGSPGAAYGLRPTRRIVEVNGTPTPDLDAFAAVVGPMADGEPVRLKTVGLDGKVQAVTLELDLMYWPTLRLERGEDGQWRRERVDRADTASVVP